MLAAVEAGVRHGSATLRAHPHHAASQRQYDYPPLAPPASYLKMCDLLPRITSSPRWQCTPTLIRLPIVPLQDQPAIATRTPCMRGLHRGCGQVQRSASSARTDAHLGTKRPACLPSRCAIRSSSSLTVGSVQRRSKQCVTISDDRSSATRGRHLCAADPAPSPYTSSPTSACSPPTEFQPCSLQSPTHAAKQSLTLIMAWRMPSLGFVTACKGP